MKCSAPHRLAQLLLLALLLPLVAACSPDDSGTPTGDDPTPVIDAAIYNPDATFSVSFTPKSLTPIYDVEEEYKLSTRQLAYQVSGKPETAHEYVYVVQGGQMTERGVCAGAVSNDYHTIDLKYNTDQAVNTSQTLDLVATNVKLTYRNGQFYAPARLKRQGGADWVWRGSGKGARVTATTDEFVGVGERCYVVNKTDRPITFRHKGFEAKELWYYDHAELGLDDHTVSGGVAVTTDSCSAVSEVLCFADNKWRTVDSFYPPTGAKISDATLVAEVDGQEVRTVNTLSSDLTLETGHVYAYVVVWDGQTLRFDDGLKPLPIDLSDPATSGVELQQLTDENHVMVRATEKTVPRPGDIIFTAPCDEFPYGFVSRVASVIKVQAPPAATPTRSALGDWVDDKLVEWYLLEIKVDRFFDLFEQGIDQWFWINPDEVTVSEVTDEEGNVLTTTSEAGLHSFKHTFTFDKDGNASLTLTPEVGFRITRLGVYLKSQEDLLMNAGFDCAIEPFVKLTAEVKKELKYKPKRKKINVEFNPITFMVGPVPVVITPLLQFYVDLELSGKVYMKFTPFNVKTYAHTGFMFDRARLEMQHLPGMKKYVEFGGFDNYPELDLDYQVGIAGKAEITPGIDFSVGFYGNNLIGRVDPPEGVEEAAWLKWAKSTFVEDICSFETYVDFTNKVDADLNIRFNAGLFNDKCQLTNEVVGHALIHLFGWDPEGKTEPWTPFDYSGCSSLLFSDFVKTKLNFDTQSLVVSAEKQAPYCQYFGYDELGFGYNLRRHDEASAIPGQPSNDDGRYYDLTKRYEAPREMLSYPIECHIPKADLVPGTKYDLHPYVRVRFLGQEYVLRRPATTFTYNLNGTITPVSLDDVPGQDL